MVNLPPQHLRRAFDFILDISALKEPESFARCALSQLPRLVDSEITTLSICDLRRGTRRVISNPDEAIAPQEQREFDRLIHQHPLVRFHAGNPGAGAWRISDSLPMSAFRETAIYNDYYRRIGIDYVLAVPIIANPQLVMSFVLNRKRRDFSDRECELLNRMQPALANLYRFAAGAACATPATAAVALTPREKDALRWVSAGKSDAQIAEILHTSVRTVQKHLQNAFVKLGVENRTAAAMRMMEIDRR